MKRAISGTSRPNLLGTLLAFAAFLLMSIAWAFSMPIAAGPDEPAHILKAAAVVRGEWIGTPMADNPSATVVRVPGAIGQAHKWPCFAYDSTIGGACQVIREAPEDADGLVAAPTTAGLYNPVYYLFVGTPTLLDLGSIEMVMAMRGLTALLSAALTAWTFAVLRRLISPLWALVVLAVCYTPMVFFLNSIVNPNSMEILGGAAFLVGLLWFATAGSVRGRAAVSPALLLAVGGVLGANARGVSPLWMFLAGLLFLIVLPKARMQTLLRTPVFLGSLGAVVLAALFGVLWVLRTGTLNRMGEFPGQDGSPARIFFRMLLNAPSDPGLIAYFGWLDTPAPGFVYAAYGYGILALLVVAISTARGRWRWAILAGFGVFLLVPAILQAASLKSSGFIWQGRYSLVGLVLLLIVAGVSLLADGRSDARSELPAAAVVSGITITLILLAMAQFWALFSNIQRYAVDEGDSPLDVFTLTSWQPPGLGALGVIGLYGLALLVFVLLALPEIFRLRRQPLQQLFLGSDAVQELRGRRALASDPE